MMNSKIMHVKKWAIATKTVKLAEKYHAINGLEFKGGNKMMELSHEMEADAIQDVLNSIEKTIEEDSQELSVTIRSTSIFKSQ